MSLATFLADDRGFVCRVCRSAAGATVPARVNFANFPLPVHERTA